MATTRIYLISDTRLFREGLSVMVRRENRLDVIGHGTLADALNELRDLAPELLLLDMTGPESLLIPRRLHLLLPDLRIVAVALAEQEADILACAEAGICAYVPQTATVEELVAIILRSLEGELVCSPRIAALLFDRVATLAKAGLPGGAIELLTPREREIAALLALGLQNKEIARRLQLGTATVKNHVHNILQKLQIGRRSEIFGRRFMLPPWHRPTTIQSRQPEP